jgi:serine/threonine protein kinase
VIREDNTPVLIDFGTARDTLNSNSDDLTQIFTNGYAPFEQCHPTWAKQGPWTDIYSLGATLYFAITGKRIIASQLRMVNDPYEPLADEYGESYSVEFLKAVDDALLFQPKERPQSLKEWNHALNTQINKEAEADDLLNEADSEFLKQKDKEVASTKEVENTGVYLTQITDKKVNAMNAKRDAKGSFTPKLLVIVLLPLVLIAPLAYYFYPFDGTDKNKQKTDSVVLTKPQDSSKNKVEKEVVKAVKEIPKEAPKSVLTIENNVPAEITALIRSTKIKLSKDTLSFTEAITLCNTINKHMNGIFYKELREVYLTSLQKTLSSIPKVDLQQEHSEWVDVHENNVTKNKSGAYEINPEFKQMLLNEKDLYAHLTIKSSSVILDVKILGNASMCTSSLPCKTPMQHKRIKSGEKVMSFSNKVKKIKGDSTINIHPNQNYIIGFNL